MVDYPAIPLLGIYSGETFPNGPGECSRLFIAVLLMKTVKLDVTH